MTLRMEVTNVETAGYGLRIEGVVNDVFAPVWQESARCSFVAPMRYRRTYYVGRMITLKVQP